MEKLLSDTITRKDMLYYLKNLYYRILIGGLLAPLAFSASGQPAVCSQTIEITYNKTSSIVFPAVITSVDRGSPDVLAQKAKGVNNVLQLKAARSNFKDTNLTVITEDGQLHHFFVRYAELPASFTVWAPTATTQEKAGSVPLLFQNDMTESDMDRCATAIVNSGGKRFLYRSVHYQMRIALKGIYIHSNVMFYHLQVTNNSNIAYHTDMLRFFVKDRRKVTRTAAQEISEVPLFHYGDPKVITGKSTIELVFALKKFTIPEAKMLHIELVEKGGGRHLGLKVKNKSIIKARLVSVE